MLFYRVCHRASYIGPYIDAPCSLPFLTMADAHTNCVRHPSARHIDGFMSGHSRCGFESLEALHAWFESFEPMLKRHGYVTRVWEVKEDWVGTDGVQSIVSFTELTRGEEVLTLDIVSDAVIKERIEVNV